MGAFVHGESDSIQAIGAQMYALRAGKTQRALAVRLGIDQTTVSNAERGIRITPETAAAYDRHFHTDFEGRVHALVIADRQASAAPPPTAGSAPTPPGHPATLVEAGGGLVANLPPELLTGMPGGHTMPLPDGLYRVITSTGEVVAAMVIDRRLFVAGAGLAVPLAGMERTRHELLGSLAAARATADVDEWQEIAWEYGLSYLSTPPAELLHSLQVDIAALGHALRRQHADPATRELHRVAAQLATFAALTIADLGDLRSSRRWWRTAKRAADESGDVETRLWIRGGEVMRALHEQRPVPAILDLVAEAEAVSASTNAPPATLPRLLAGKARTFILAGRAPQAETALCEVRDNFDRLPARTTRDTESWFGWSEQSLRFTESFIYSHAGDVVRADQAQAAALALFPATQRGGRAMIGLQRAQCLVRVGDVAAGIEHAYAVMTGLSAEHHRRPVVDLANKVLDAVPATEQGRESVQAFRAYLGSRGDAV